MPDLVVNFLKGDKVDSNTDYRDALPVNMYAVERELFGVKGYMLQEPGLTLHGTGLGRDRGGFWSSRFKRHYRVSGQKLIEVAADGAVTDLGDIPGNSQATIDESFNNIAIVTDNRLFMYNPDAGLRQITDPDLGNPKDVAWIDNYFFLTDGENLYHSNIADETAFEPLDFATSEFAPDETLGVIKTRDNRVIALNRFTSEYFQNDASENFSFSRLAGRAWEVGIVGTHAKCKMESIIYFVGSYRSTGFSVYAASEGLPQPIATREIEQILGEYTVGELESVRVEGRVEDQYRTLIIHLPRHALKCNVNLLTWSILKSNLQGDEVYRAINGVFDERVGKWIYGDKFNGNIGILDESVATHYGELAECLLFTPYYYIDSASIDQLEVETIPGFTSTNDAQVFCSMTQEGVQYTQEFIMDYGNYADYQNRFIKRRIGYVRNYFSLKLRVASRSRVAFSLGRVTYG